jgi:hypothetical protein
MSLRLRRATLEDADEIAAVYSPSFRLLTFLPSLHTPAEDRRFIGEVILGHYEVTLARMRPASSRSWPCVASSCGFSTRGPTASAQGPARC